MNLLVCNARCRRCTRALSTRLTHSRISPSGPLTGGQGHVDGKDACPMSLGCFSRHRSTSRLCSAVRLSRLSTASLVSALVN